MPSWGLAAILPGCSGLPAAVAPAEVPTPTVGANDVALTPSGARITAPAVAAPTDWPADTWRPALPEDPGLDAQTVAQVVDAIQARGQAPHNRLVIRNGYRVSETYFGPDQARAPDESSVGLRL